MHKGRRPTAFFRRPSRYCGAAYSVCYAKLGRTPFNIYYSITFHIPPSLKIFFQHRPMHKISISHYLD
jgi:hypothetical protein